MRGERGLLAAAVALAVIGVAVAVTGWGLGGGTAARAAAPQLEITVERGKLSFTPNEITVAAGGRLLFTNRDRLPHTITADGGLFDSGVLDNGGRFEYSFAGPRVVTFHCEIHPGMKGEIRVVD